MPLVAAASLVEEVLLEQLEMYLEEVPLGQVDTYPVGVVPLEELGRRYFVEVVPLEQVGMCHVVG